ncbi:MAG: Tyrosine--tRNA ligase, mitochondrial, partial [Paramarteilia canceri]
MQAFDWLNLYRKFGCTIQLAGSDQIGNIHMGIELIKKHHKSASAYGITTELLTDQNNKKLSKSASDQDFNLDSSPYQLYQNLINLPDSTVLDMRAKLLCQNSFSKSPEVSVLKREFIFSILEIIYSSETSLFIKKAIDLLYVQKLRSLAETDAETISLLDMILQKFVFTPKINSNLKNFFYDLIKDPSLSN